METRVLQQARECVVRFLKPVSNYLIDRGDYNNIRIIITFDILVLTTKFLSLDFIKMTRLKKLVEVYQKRLLKSILDDLLK